MTPTLAVSETARGSKLLRRLRADRRVVVKTQHGYTRAQDVHRVGVLRRILQEFDHGRGQGARGAEVRLELIELRLVRQRLVPEEINDFLVTDLPRQLIDVVARVNQHALVPHHVTETRGGGDDPLETGRGNGHNLN